MDISLFVRLMNSYGLSGEPFLFIIDFEMKNPEIYKIDSVPASIKFSTPLISNIVSRQIYSKPLVLRKYPVSLAAYSEAFRIVMNNIRIGNTYLLNLTFPTPIDTQLTLEEIFMMSKARYRLLYDNRFVVFSPETFIRIEDGMIKSFPMKGTIDGSLPGAAKIILNDEKETAEHNTIVDLIRNDLSIVAANVEVTRYRYVEKIATVEGELLQVSSEITGELSSNHRKQLGNIITAMLPAGSVTGAPKRETIRIIGECEKYKRGWYTGVFGVFDGERLDSSVMIRFIENEAGRMVYKSGGGITCMSNVIKEYEELIAKIYVPVG